MLRDPSTENSLNKDYVLAAIDSIKGKGWDINPFTVADEMKVPRAVIYQNIEFMTLIIEARGGSFGMDMDSSLTVARRIQELEAYINQLQTQLEQMHKQLQPLEVQDQTTYESGVHQQPKLTTETGEPEVVPPQAIFNAASLAPVGNSQQSISELSWKELEAVYNFTAASLMDLSRRMSGEEGEFDDQRGNVKAQGSPPEVTTIDEVTAADDASTAAPTFENAQETTQHTRPRRKRKTIHDESPEIKTPEPEVNNEPIPEEVDNKETSTGDMPIAQAESYVESAIDRNPINPKIQADVAAASVESIPDDVLDSLSADEFAFAEDAKEANRNEETSEHPVFFDPPAQPQMEIQPQTEMPPQVDVSPKVEIAQPIEAVQQVEGPQHAQALQQTDIASQIETSQKIVIPPNINQLEHAQAPIDFSKPGYEEPAPPPVQDEQVEEEEDPSLYHPAAKEGSADRAMRILGASPYESLTNIPAMEMPPSLSMHEQAPLPEEIPDLETMDIFEDFSSAEALENIEMIEGGGIEGEEESPESDDAISGDELRELIQNRIKQATDHLGSDTIPPSAEETADVEPKSGLGFRSKFVGTKAQAAAPGFTTTRVVPPEIRKSCLILGVRPEEITVALVVESWKKQIAAPGVHPDLGGDTESAIYLNTAKDMLVRWIEAQEPKLSKKFGTANKEKVKPDPKDKDKEKAT